MFEEGEIIYGLLQYEPSVAYTYVFAKVIKVTDANQFLIRHLKIIKGPIVDHHRSLRPMIDIYTDEDELVEIGEDGSYYDEWIKTTIFYEKFTGNSVGEYDPLDWEFDCDDIK